MTTLGQTARVRVPDSSTEPPMFKKLAQATVIGALLAVTAGCNNDGAKSGASAGSGADRPDEAILASARLARQGDIAGLVEHLLPPAEFARIKSEWNDRSSQPEISDEDRTRFAEAMAKLTAPDAVDAIYAEIEPDLKQFDAQYKAQLPGMVAMGQGYLQGLVQQSNELSPAEKEQALAAVKSLGEWAQKTPFTDPTLVRKSLETLATTARALDIKTLDEARALDFEHAAPKLGIAFNGLKQLLDGYGLSIDQALDSVTTEVVSNDGTHAKVRVSYSFLGAPLSTHTDMVKIDGRWYGKDTIDKIAERKAGGDVTAPKAGNG